MDITTRSIDDIRPYESNPRINDSAVDAVAASLKEFGFRYPGRNGVMGICKPCASHLAVEYKRKRRHRVRLRALLIATIALGMLPPVVDGESPPRTESARPRGPGRLG